MAQFNKTVITNKGLNAIAKAVSNNDIIKFTKFKISDTKYKYNDLINLSDVSSKSTIDVEKVSIMDDETVELYSILSNKNIEAGFYIETIGLFAIDSNGNEYLYSVTTAEVADYLPKYEGVSIANIYICLCIKVGQSEVVSVQTVMKGFVNDDEFQIHKDSDNTRYNEFKTHVIQDDQRYGEYKTHVVQDNQRYDEYKTHVAQDNQRYDEYKAHVTQDDQRYDEYKSHVIKDNQRYDEYKAHALQDDQRYNAHVTQDNQRYDEYKAHVAQDNQRYDEYKAHVSQDDQRYNAHVTQDNQRYDEYKTHVVQDNQRYDEYKAHVVNDNQRYNEYKAHVVQDDQRYNEFKAFQTVENEREANNQDEHSVINDDVLGLYNLLIEKYMPVTGIKNILVNSNFTQQITGFNSNVNGSGTTHITDLYDYYSTSNTKTNIYKNYSSELKGNYLNVSSTEAKGYNTSYIETFSLIPFDCEGFNYTFSFKARNIKNTKKLRVTIYNVNNSYTQDVTLNSFFQTYNFKVNKALPISNGLQNKIYVKIEFANNDIYADANLEFDIACLQITKGANYYTYLPKSLDTDCEEIKNYYIKFVACGLMPYYSQKAATMYTLNLMLYRVANYYLKNFDYESGIRMYEILTDSEGYITKKEFKNFKTMSGNYKGHYMFKLYINSIDGSDLPPNLMLDHVEDSTTAYFEIN